MSIFRSPLPSLDSTPPPSRSSSPPPSRFSSPPPPRSSSPESGSGHTSTTAASPDPTYEAACEPSHALTASLVSVGSCGYDPESAAVSINECAAMTGSIASLAREAGKLDANAVWNGFAGESPEDCPDIAAVLQELKAMSSLNVRVLDMLESFSRQQTSVSERLYQLDDQTATLRSAVQRSQSSSSRLLYRTKEHVRNEREKIRDDTAAMSKTQEKHDDAIRALAVNVAQAKVRNAELAISVHRLECEMQAAQTAARAELDALRASLWSSKACAAYKRVLAIFICTFTTLLVGVQAGCRQIKVGCTASAQWCVRTVWEYADLLRLIGIALFLCAVFFEEFRGVPAELPDQPVDTRPIWESARARLR